MIRYLTRKAMSVGNDAAGGYLAPAQHGSKPIPMLRPKKTFKAAQELTPPPGGHVLWQTATIRFRNSRALLDYGYKLSYEFQTVEQVKQFLGQAQQLGWHLANNTTQVLDAYAREQQHGVPFGIDWQHTLARSKQDTAAIAARLNAENPKSVVFRLVDSGTNLPVAKPSMSVTADRMPLGTVAFREHVQALAAIAKRLGATVRAQSPQGMMSVADAVRPTRSTATKAILPPLLPGGQTSRGQSTISLDSLGTPFRWQLDYLVRKEYQFPDSAAAEQFAALARRQGYSIQDVNAKPGPRIPGPSYDPVVNMDIESLRRNLPKIGLMRPPEEVILRPSGNGVAQILRRHPAGPNQDKWQTTYLFDVRSRQGVQLVRNAARRAGVEVIS